MSKLRYGSAKDAGMDQGRVEALRRQAPMWIDPRRMRSAVLFAARRGTIFYHEAFGPLTDAENSPPMEKDSIIHVASITKTVTATCIMMLVEDGLLGLNRPIKEYLPEVCGKGTDDVEVQHLLTHTSGYSGELADEIFEKVLRAKLDDPSDLERAFYRETALYFSTLWDLDISRAPGEVMDYSDHNINLLGEIVGRVSGLPLDQFAKQRLFDPLGMKDTSYGVDPRKEARRVVRAKKLAPVEGVWGGNGLHTSAHDLGSLGQMILQSGKYDGRRILSPASVYEMTRNQIPGIGTEFLGSHDEASWGLGWGIQGDERWKWSESTLTPKGTVQHLGAGGNCIWIDPVNEIVGVYLSVCLDVNFDIMEHHFNLDLFQNMVTAAVGD